MNKLISMTMLTGALFAGQALAFEWSPIKIEGNTVREVDASSIARNGPVVLFSSRHTFVDPSEYTVARDKAKYLVIHNRGNCDSRTLAQLATEAYDEKMVLIGKQQIRLPQDLPVTKESIDEAMLNFICEAGK